MQGSTAVADICLVSEENRSDIMSGNDGAPSLGPEAFPAVTVPVPSLTKQGLSSDMLPMLLPCRGNSSTFTSTGPEGQRLLLQCMHAKD